MNFATLFDINYLSRGLCLIDSLTQVLKQNYQLFILALDEETANYFYNQNNPQLVVISLPEIEKKYPDLLIAKNNRNKVEYYFTLSPVLPFYILETYPDCARITTLDADIYFFSDPSVILTHYQKDDILITPHDFSSNLLFLEDYGRYNVSFQSFPNTADAKILLQDWMKKCLTWCKDVLDPVTGYFADQKYLDRWKIDFKNVCDIDLKTAGRAPWNINETPLNLKQGKLLVNGQPLIYYHFHHLRIYDHFIAHGINLYGPAKVNREVRELYRTYILNLKKNSKLIKTVSDNQVIRYNSPTQSSSLLSTMWQRELGAIYIPQMVVFFNLTYIKRVYRYLLKKKNGLFN